MNVASLATSEARGDFHGFVRTGMVLKGKTSGAEASISNLRLISDLSATLIGSFYIPNPIIRTIPKFETGTKVFTLVNDKDNNQDAATTIAEEVFTSAGTLEKLFKRI